MSIKSSKPENEKLNKGFTKAGTALAVLFTLIFLILFIMIGTGFIRICICIFWLMFMKAKMRNPEEHNYVSNLARMLVMTAILGCMSLFAPIIFSKSAWKYNLQRKYIDLYNKYSSVDFPDKLSGNIGNYKFEYVPSIMQGNGHCSVRFTASADDIKAYEREYAPKAIYAIPLSRFDFGDTVVEEVSPEAVVPYEGGNNLSMFVDSDFWGDTKATVYVLSAVHDWNHPHSHVVIISSDYRKIQFSQY